MDLFFSGQGQAGQGKRSRSEIRQVSSSNISGRCFCPDAVASSAPGLTVCRACGTRNRPCCRCGICRPGSPAPDHPFGNASAWPPSARRAQQILAPRAACRNYAAWCDFAATAPGLRLPLGTGLGVAEATFVFTSVFLRRLTAGASNTKGGTPAGRKHDERKCGDPRSPREHAKAPSLQPGRHDVSRLLSSACRRTAGARAFR